MTHPEDGTLQAFLDDELPPGERARVAEHLLGCDRCRAAHESLSRANATFDHAVSLLDVEAPAATRPPFGRRARAGAGSFVKAAGLVLAFAAAASAAVPGSPVHEWIARAVEPGPAPEAEAPPPVATVDPVPVASPPSPAGVSVQAADGPAVVSLSGLEGAEIRLTGGAGPAASVQVLGADVDPAFRTGSSRIHVMDGSGGTVDVTLPLALPGSRLEVDGRVYAEVADGGLLARVPADTVDGALTWR